MSVRGPDHAFHVPDASDRPEAARPWAPTRKRRALVVTAFGVMAVLALALGWMIETTRAAFAGAADARAVVVAAIAGLAAAIAAIWVDRALYKSTRPVFALPGEVDDERRAALVTAATLRARGIAFVAIAALTGLGAAPVAAGFVLAAGVAALGLTMAGPQILLAWTLPPEEFAFDDETAAGGGANDDA